MDKYTQGRQISQARCVEKHRGRILESQDLCFTELLPREDVEEAIQRTSRLLSRTSLHTFGG